MAGELQEKPAAPAALSAQGRYIVLVAAFLGWMSAGIEFGMYLAARPAIKSMLANRVVTATFYPVLTSVQVTSAQTREAEIGRYFAWYLCAFLLGAALGGLLFGWLGDIIGRSKAMGLSILCFSVLTGVAYFAQSIEQLLVLRFVACLGVGGMWPSGVALASEAWPDASRPLLSGLIGTSANVGLVIIGLIGSWRGIHEGDWRWLMLAGATPVVLGALVLLVVPESPAWLADRARRRETKTQVPISTVFRPPYLKLTILGIVLGTIPLLGGWGSINWLIPWADQVSKDSGFSSDTQTMRSAGAALGSLMGGWLASWFGRRITYFVVSLVSLIVSGYMFWFMTPESHFFLTWTFVLGFVATIYFGWLPLYLPELYPVSVRATGSGVTFNFGRILSAVGVLAAGTLMSVFHGSYAQTGRVTHLIFAVGMIVILFAPDTTNRRMDE